MTACTSIYEALKKTGGKTDGEALVAAAKGMTWESPRGPISIDPETRDIVQNVYIRRVEKVGGELVNVEFDKIENVKDIRIVKRRYCRVRALSAEGGEAAGPSRAGAEIGGCDAESDPCRSGWSTSAGREEAACR